MTNSSTHLRSAALAYLITGMGYLAFGFPFWFLGAQDQDIKGKYILPFIYLVDERFPLSLKFWVGLITVTFMFMGAFSLWKIGEPTGFSKKRNFLLVSMAGALSYFLGTWIPLPFAPLGAFLSGLGMILVGIASLKANVWTGWKRYAPLIAGCFPFLFMFPILILTGARPPAMIGLWGFPWMALGLAAWQRSKEDSIIKVAYND